MIGAEDAERLPLLLLDTHTLIWLTDGNQKLGESTRAVIRRAYTENRATVSAITPWEIASLVSKGRVTLEHF